MLLTARQPITNYPFTITADEVIKDRTGDNA